MIFASNLDPWLDKKRTYLRGRRTLFIRHVMELLIYLLLAVLFWGVAPIFGKLGLEEISPLAAISVRSFGISLILLAVTVFTGQWQGLREINARSAGLVLAEGVCAGLLGHFAYYYALKGGEVSETILLTRAAPVVTVFLSYVLLGERLTTVQLGGMALIVAGSVLMIL